MIISVMATRDDPTRPVVLLGLTPENLARLQEGQPIKINLSRPARDVTTDLPDMDVVLFYGGEVERRLLEQMAQTVVTTKPGPAIADNPAAQAEYRRMFGVELPGLRLVTYELPPPRACSCGAEPGTRHFEGCDVALCMTTGTQLVQCGGEHHEYKRRWYGEHDGPCGPDTWSGHWPGEVEAVERGWFTDITTPVGQRSVPDLSRVAVELKWDPATERFVDR